MRAMRVTAVILIVCIAAVFLAASVAVVPVMIALAEPACEMRGSTGLSASTPVTLQPIALAGDLTFRGPPVV
jgi:hypothetical protein